MEKVDLPDMQKGVWKVEKYTTQYQDWGSLAKGRPVPVGETFTRVMRNGTLVMSDTPSEQQDHWEPVYKAAGSCLINGLGIGLVLKNVLLKQAVTDVTVVEVYQDLIDLVSPYYADPRVAFVCCDAFVYKPPKGKRYTMVWHDIWDNICADNLSGMTKLHRKFGKCCHWQGSWCKYQCQRQKQNEDRWRL